MIHAMAETSSSSRLAITSSAMRPTHCCSRYSAPACRPASGTRWPGWGGMNHFMLPESPDGRWGRAAFSLRYGNFAMEQLINGILRQGGRRERLEVKVFGGARIGPDSSEIGERNANYVEDYLRTEGLVPLATELRGSRARRLAYMPVSGRAFMVELPPHATPAEVQAPVFPSRMPTSGSVELF